MAKKNGGAFEALAREIVKKFKEDLQKGLRKSTAQPASRPAGGGKKGTSKPKQRRLVEASPKSNGPLPDSPAALQQIMRTEKDVTRRNAAARKFREMRRRK